MPRVSLLKLEIVGLLIIGVILLSCTLPESGADIPAVDGVPGEAVSNESLTSPPMEAVNPGYWTRMPLNYYINKEECGKYETNRIRRAFSELEEKTQGTVRFKEQFSPAEPDLSLKCSFTEDCYQKGNDFDSEEGVIYVWETICAHPAGMANITASEGDSILKAEIELFGLAGFAESGIPGVTMSGFYVGNCGNTNVEIHEILHTFGYGHVDDEKSIMYYADDLVPYTRQEPGQCLGSKDEIDQNIIDDLVRTYQGGQVNKVRQIAAMNWSEEPEEEPEERSDYAALSIADEDWKMLLRVTSFEDQKVESDDTSRFFMKVRPANQITLQVFGRYDPEITDAQSCQDGDYGNVYEFRKRLMRDYDGGPRGKEAISLYEKKGVQLSDFEFTYRYGSASGKAEKAIFKNLDAYVYHDGYCFNINMIDDFFEEGDLQVMDSVIYSAKFVDQNDQTKPVTENNVYVRGIQDVDMK